MEFFFALAWVDKLSLLGLGFAAWESKRGSWSGGVAEEELNVEGWASQVRETRPYTRLSQSRAVGQGQ